MGFYISYLEFVFETIHIPEITTSRRFEIWSHVFEQGLSGSVSDFLYVAVTKCKLNKDFYGTWGYRSPWSPGNVYFKSA
jgi:hypothetical protein